jgi:hypothetical protein
MPQLSCGSSTTKLEVLGDHSLLAALLMEFLAQSLAEVGTVTLYMQRGEITSGLQYFLIELQDKIVSVMPD